MRLFENEREILKVVSVAIILLLIIAIPGAIYLTVQSLAVKERTENLFSDPVLGWDFKNLEKYRFNDCGVRDELSCKKIAQLNKQKVIFLGNSVVMGKAQSIQETFIKQFQHRVGNDFYAINAGYDGYEIYREFYKFKRDLMQLKPSLVVWVLSRNDLRAKSTLKNIIQETQKAQNIHEKKISSFRIFIKNLKRIEYIKLLKKWFLNRSEQWFDSWKDRYYVNGILKRPSRKVINAVMKEVGSFDLFLKKNNCQLVVLFIPDRAFSMFYEWKDAQMFQEFSMQFDRLKIPWRSVVNEFHNNGSLYSDYVHMNTKGHRLLGKLLAEKLKDL